MSVGSLFLSNPKFWAWMTLLVAYVLGGATVLYVVYLLRVRIFGRAVAEKYHRANTSLQYRNEVLDAENKALKGENAELRAWCHQATIKAHQGIAVISSGLNTQVPPERQETRLGPYSENGRSK